MDRTYEIVQERLDRAEFSTFGAIARWLPSIDEEIATTIIRTEAASGHMLEIAKIFAAGPGLSQRKASGLMLY